MRPLTFSYPVRELIHRPYIKGVAIVAMILALCACSPALEQAVGQTITLGRTLQSCTSSILTDSDLEGALGSLEFHDASEQALDSWFLDLGLVDPQTPCIVSDDGLALIARYGPEPDPLSNMKKKLAAAHWIETESGTDSISTWVSTQKGGWLALCQQKDGSDHLVTMILSNSARMPADHSH